MSADDIVRDACGSRFTAAVLRVEARGAVAFERAYGTTAQGASAAPVFVTTRFDLASLTKLFAATAALQAAAEGAFALDAGLEKLVPEWRGTPHEPITARMLLAHTSGMHSGADYRELLGDDVERFALRRPLAVPPGRGVIYSDLGYIALGVLLGRARGRGLASVVAATCAALTAEATAYRPSVRDVAAIPATECDAWRGRVQGFVHDEKAYLMNGVAGHAGLFGTARDVAALAEAYLGGMRGRAGALPAALAREAVAEHASDPVLRRGLGWALKTSDENSCGALMSRATFGHTGFTGTSVWSDPERDLTVVLLTNAVYFGRGDLRDVRAAVADAAVGEFG
jgi:CubicO group peptidase (beta-lactamase class C family)